MPASAAGCHTPCSSWFRPAITPNVHHRAGQRHGDRHHARALALVGPCNGSSSGLVWCRLGVKSWHIVEAGGWQQIPEGRPDKFRVAANACHEMTTPAYLPSTRYEAHDRLMGGALIFFLGHNYKGFGI